MTAPLYTFLLHCLFFNIITVYYNTLSSGCCDEEISPFAGQIKEILILILKMWDS